MAASKSRFNIELLLGISATFLSLAALVVSIFQTKIAREQQDASVWPYLQADYTKANDSFVWTVVNNGIGPAVIKSTALRYRGRIYKDAYELINEQIQHLSEATPKGKTAHVNFFYGGLSRGNVIKSEGEIKLGEMSGNESIADTLLHIVQDTSYHFTVVYSDVYGNCWQLDQDEVTALGKCDTK
ncbi:hypothetical protein [Spirosoma gilvum]